MSSQSLDNKELKKTVDRLEKEAKELASVLKSMGDIALAASKNINEVFNKAFKNISNVAPTKSGGENKTEEEVSSLIEQYKEVSQMLEYLFDETSERSVTALRTIIKQAKKMYKALEKGKYKESFDISEEQFDALRNSPDDMAKIKAAIADMDTKADKLGNTLQKIGANLKIIFSSDAKDTGLDKVAKDAENATTPLDAIIKKKADVNAAWKDLVKYLGEINEFSESAGKSVASVFTAYGKKDGAETANNIAGMVGGVGQAGVGIAKFASGDIIGGLKDSIEGVAKAITSIAKLRDGVKEKDIQVLQKKYDALDELIKAVDKDIAQKKWEAGRSSGSEKSDIILKENELLVDKNKDIKAQQEIITKQIEKEKEKKNTDDEKIKKWKEQLVTLESQIETNQRAIEDNKRLAIESIIGKDVKSAIDEFAQAYVNAWAAGEDKAASMSDVVKNMIKTAITTLVKSRMSGEVEAYMDYLATAMEDGMLSVVEENTLDALEAAIFNKLNGLDGSLNDYIVEKTKDGEATRQASAQGIASMSQESADDLSGRFTAIQYHTSSISENMKTLTINSGQVLRHLAGIESNTKYCENLNDINKNIAFVKSGIDNINLKGVTIKY